MTPDEVKAYVDNLRVPGLIPEEVPVLKAWLLKHYAEYDRVDYNVRLGKGYDPGPSYPDYARSMSILNSQYRLDAVAWRGNVATIVECKVRASASAIGQILLYRQLLSKADTAPASIACVLACVSRGADVLSLAESADISVETFAV